MRDKKTYVFFGYWSEYSLHPLYEYLCDQGYNCVEITPDSCADMRLDVKALAGRNTVFITSAHLFLDANYPGFNAVNGALSPLEVMDILKPARSVFYPHDLTDLFHDIDQPWLTTVFDILLFPFDGMVYLSAGGCDVHNVGWIKKHKPVGPGRKGKVAHGFSEMGHYYSMGFDQMYDVFSPVWSTGVSVKFADYYTTGQFEAYLKQRASAVIDSKTPMLQVIEQHEIILTNSLTSVNLESALSGRLTINMLDGVYAQEVHRARFSGIPNLLFHTVAETADLLQQYRRGAYRPEQGEDQLGSFDFALAEKIITQ